MKRANVEGSRTISLEEAAKLPKDLQDNWVKFGKVEVSKKELIDGFVKTITDGAKRADTNKEGYLTAKNCPSRCATTSRTTSPRRVTCSGPATARR